MEEIFVMGRGEAVLKTDELMLLSFAEGAVDPRARIENGELDEGRAVELITRLQNREFITNVDPESIPCNCMDCRAQTNGQMVVSAKAAGGTETLTIADALTTNSYRHAGEKAPEHKKRLYGELITKGHKVGGHRADNVSVEGYAGCGAEDKLDSHDDEHPSILRFITQKPGPLFATLRSLNYEIEPELEAGIVSKAETLRQEGYATSGKELSQAGVEVAGEESLRTLTGPQKAVVVALLTKPGEVLDQQAIADEFGPDYQVFEIETWAIENGANATSLGKDEPHQKLIAGLIYNLAAGAVIAGPGMPVVIL